MHYLHVNCYFCGYMQLSEFPSHSNVIGLFYATVLRKGGKAQSVSKQDPIVELSVHRKKNIPIASYIRGQLRLIGNVIERKKIISNAFTFSQHVIKP